MMFSISFPLPSRPINMNMSMHWADRGRLVSAWKEAARIATLQGINTHQFERHQPFSVVGISIPVHSLKVRRDPHNWAPTLKVAIDGMVAARLFDDDSSDYLATTEPHFHLCSDNPNVVVTITGAS